MKWLLITDNKKNNKKINDFIKNIDQNKELLDADKKLHSEIDNVRDGMLSMQGRNFKNDCHKLLKKDHVIDVKEYE